MEKLEPGLWTIPAGLGFTRCLATGLTTALPAQLLTKALIFVPYQRALQDVAYQLCCVCDHATFLPQLVTLKNILPALEYLLCPLPRSAKPLPSLERLGFLTQLISQKSLNVGGEKQTYTFEMALTLAEDLSQVLDAACLEEVDLSCLQEIVPGQFSHHWQVTLQFLEILSKTWPHLLREKGYANPYDVLVTQTDALIRYFEEYKPQMPIIVAGSTGSTPRVRRLMKAILQLPQGLVVLPGFEHDCHNQTIHNAHPQKTMETLLRDLGKEASDVRVWPVKEHSHNKARRRLLVQTFDEKGVDGVAVDQCDVQKACAGLSIAVAHSEHEESLVIALAIKRALDAQHQTVVACIPDPSVSGWVHTHLKRFQIEAFNSAGELKMADRTARLALFCLKWGENLDDLPTLLDILKHPLSAATFNPEYKAHIIGLFETTVLRAPPSCVDFLMLNQRIQESPHVKYFSWMMRWLTAVLLPLTQVQHNMPVAVWCDALKKVLEKLKVGDDSSFYQVLDGLIEASASFAPLNLHNYRILLENTLKHSTHPEKVLPRVHLLGTLEARLIQGDVMILSCLNEGQWPVHAPDSPWLNRAMRAHLGLLDDMRKQSLQAHDFFSTCAAPRVLLTRSCRHQDVLTVPSRFLLALERTLAKNNMSLPVETDLLHGARTLDAPTAVKPCTPPGPFPHLSALPTQLSVTAVNYLQKDPYSFYARYVLNLKPLLALRALPGPALWGTLLHQLMEQFHARKKHEVERKTLEKLFLEMGHQLLEPFKNSPDVCVFWYRRLEKLTPHVVALLDSLKPQTRIYTEIWGAQTFVMHTLPITVCARADRLDVSSEGISIVDYKTGALPSDRDLEKGLALQLPLEPLLVLEGGFKGLPTCLKEVSFWQLGKNHVFTKSLKDPTLSAQQAFQTLEDLVSCFYIQKKPFKATIHNPFKDYDHLARMPEWRRA